MESVLYVSRTPDKNGERHRWTFVEGDHPGGRYVRHERFVDVLARSGVIEAPRATETIEFATFLIGDYDSRAKNELIKLLNG